jgi:hypothetical protein
MSGAPWETTDTERLRALAAAGLSVPEIAYRTTITMAGQRQLVGRFLGSNRMLAGTEVVKCPCEMRAWSLSTKVLL